MTLNSDALREGYIWHCRTSTWIGVRIRRVLSLRGGPCWGNHDGLVLWDAERQTLAIGEALFPTARATPLAAYIEEMATGATQVRVFRPLAWTSELGAAVARVWWRECLNRPYDVLAYPKLLLKALLGDWISGVAGWEWAHWCTEQVDLCYRLNGVVLFPGEENATPKHVEKWSDPQRTGHTLLDITEAVLPGAVRHTYP